MKFYYLLLSYHHQYTKDEIVESDPLSLPKLKEQLIQEHNIHPNLLISLGPFFNLEEAKRLLSFTKEKQKLRRHFLVTTNDSYFVDFGTFKEVVMKAQILGLDFNSLDVFGPFKREWEAEAHLQNV